jgi:hypothetical protein
MLIRIRNTVEWSAIFSRHFKGTLRPATSNYSFVSLEQYVRGASKIKLKKVNKMRTVTVRRVIIFLNISRRPLLICLHCCLHQYKTLKAVARAIAAIVLLTPAKNLNKVFWGFLVVSPLVNHYQGYV